MAEFNFQKIKSKESKGYSRSRILFVHLFYNVLK